MIYVSRSSPVLITTQKYMDYGGDINCYTNAQLTLSLSLAEMSAERYLQTYVVPTTVTGTYVYPIQSYDHRLSLGVNYVSSVGGVTHLHEQLSEETLTEVSGYAHILDGGNGLIDVRMSTSPACRCGYNGVPYQVRVAFTAGLNLPNDPQLLAALKTLTDYWLTQNFNPSEFAGGVGDPGIVNWSSLDYSETRAPMSVKSTMFGNSPQANMIIRLLRPFRKYKALRIPRT